VFVCEFCVIDFASFYVCLYINYVHIQGVPEGIGRFREGVPYIKVYRYNPKHLCPKLNCYGDNGQ